MIKLDNNKQQQEDEKEKENNEGLRGRREEGVHGGEHRGGGGGVKGGKVVNRVAHKLKQVGPRLVKVIGKANVAQNATQENNLGWRKPTRRVP